ncbi:ATP-binding protein [Paenibacillus sp. NEAU-GSW1]|uniref:ATP-binding protein n=1 Tax=Paenibacillus sp. NEAU-GSW1 TaxID=2682486 RepID=UPI0012E2A0AC|nr:ATP-binding protein [Paenibacillus sp. NEAU-GSW1]MUT67846.1 hypothetical protein [Paenibacillus sp. NEAU-GSW1]
MEDQYKNLILQRYPFPIAVYYKSLLQKERMKAGIANDKVLFDFSIYMFDMMNRFLAVLALSNYVHEGAFSQELNQRLAQKLTKKLSMGDWLEILRETVRAFGNCREKLFMPELLEFLFTVKPNGKLEENATLKQFASLLQIRNKKYGHTLGSALAEYESLYRENMLMLQSILQKLEFLDRYDLISPIGTDGKSVTSYQVLNGENIAVKYDSLKMDQPAMEGEIFYLKKNNGVYNSLKLTPFSYFDTQYENEESYVYFYDEVDRKKDVIRKFMFFGVAGATKYTTHAVEDNDEQRQLYRQFRELLFPLLGGERGTFAEEPARIPRRNYYFANQIDLIVNYRRRFIGRGHILESVRTFMEEQPSGYLLLKAAPGQGKTAVMACVSDQEQYVHHFVSSNGGCNNEKAMIQSLYYQISGKMGHEVDDIQDDPEELKRDFINLLAAFSAFCATNGRKEAIVIDGLDELSGVENGVKLAYFPDYLPQHIYVLASSRSIQGLESLHSRINKELELDELTYEETEGIILASIPSASHGLILQIYNSCKGNPLFLQCIVESIKGGGDLKDNMGKIPNSLDLFFRNLMIELRNAEDQAKLSIMGLLVTARNGLSIPELAKMIGVTRHHVHATMRSLSGFLAQTGKKFTIFHKRIVEVLLEDDEYAFDEEEIAQYHRMIIDYCMPYQEKESDYAYRYLPFHFHAIGDLKGILQLREDIELFRDAITALLVELALAYGVSPVKARSRTDRLYSLFAESKDSELYRIVIDAFEQVIAFGCFDFCVPHLETMERLWTRDEEPELRIKLLYQLAWIDREKGHLEKAYNTFNEIQANISDVLDHSFRIKIGMQHANAAREFALPDVATQLYKETLELCSVIHDPDKYLDIKQFLNDGQYVRSLFVETHAELQQDIAIAREKGLLAQEADMLRLEGQIYYLLEQFANARDSFNKALALVSKLNDKIRLGRIYNNLALAFAYIDPKETETFGKLALQLNTELSAKLELGKSYEALAIAARRKGQLELSRQHMEQAFSLFENAGYRSGLAFAFHHHAILALKQSDPAQAIQYAERSNEYLKRRKVPSYPVLIAKNAILRQVANERMGRHSQESLDNEPLYQAITSFESKDELFRRFRNQIVEECLSEEVQWER